MLFLPHLLILLLEVGIGLLLDLQACVGPVEDEGLAEALLAGLNTTQIFIRITHFEYNTFTIRR